MAVNGPRQHLAPGASLAVKQYRTTTWRDTRQHLDDLPHRRRRAEDAVRRHLHLVGVGLGFVRQRQQVLGVRDDGAQLPRHQRPRQDVEDAGPERLERGLRPLRIDDADEHRAGPLGADVARDAQRLAAARAVQQAQRGRVLAQFAQRLRDARGPAQLQAEAPERRLDGGAVRMRPANPDDAGAERGGRGLTGRRRGIGKHCDFLPHAGNVRARRPPVGTCHRPLRRPAAAARRRRPDTRSGDPACPALGVERDFGERPVQSRFPTCPAGRRRSCLPRPSRAARPS